MRYVTKSMSITEDGVISLSFDSPANSDKLTGVRAVIADRDALFGTKIQIDVDGRPTIMDSNFLLDLLETETGAVAPKERFFDADGEMDYEAKGGRIDITVTDAGNADAYPYILLLQFRFTENSN